ncbi:uncharacterized protein LOC6649285 [Drosophila willistoni]|uniref:uncharacterized protein LOC6649285 n=1 Tax=Drosophila willistoni TaxID=7260 RepID=UPI000C26CE49|nr:uncharacterized protein LOC6649285 [Drosophila willistoni]
MSSDGNNDSLVNKLNALDLSLGNTTLEAIAKSDNIKDIDNPVQTDDYEVVDEYDLSLPCKPPPQTATENGNCDDCDEDHGSGNRSNSSSVIFVEDSTDSSVVSIIPPSDTDTSNKEDNEQENAWTTVTISETASDTNSVDCSRVSMQKVVEKSPNKRCLSNGGPTHSSLGRNKRMKRRSEKRKYEPAQPNSSLSSVTSSELFSDDDEQEFCRGLAALEMPQPSSASSSSPKVVITRSGRTIRARLNLEFDYSSEIPEEDEDEEEEAEHEADTEDDETCSEEDDDYSEDADYTDGMELPKWSNRKHRRTLSSTQTASSTSQSSESEINATPCIIYLDLSQPIARVRREPQMDTSIDQNEQLMIKLKKLLGLVAARRRLYNPSDNYSIAEDEEKVSQLESPNSTLPNTNATASITVLTVPASPPPAKTWSTQNLSNSKLISTAELQKKIIDDNVLRINGISYAESQMPIHLRQEPIDLSELPPQTQRDQLCRQHKSCFTYLEQHPLFYNFVESLSPEISLNMCHPLATSYRNKDFQQCKQQLAKILFNMFNHRIFYCGLRPQIIWKRSLTVHSSRLIVSGEQARRSAIIILSESIQQPAVLVKSVLHEMCHAAAFVFNAETGHGDNCRKWSYLAKSLMPELPFVGDCDATYKYSCYLCEATSFGRINFPDDGDDRSHEMQQHLHCSYCQFEVLVEPWQSDFPHSWSCTDPLMTPYKKFIKNNYSKVKEPVTSHNEKMRQLNLEYMQQMSN